jgi:transposase
VQRQKVETSDSQILSFVSTIDGARHLVMDETTITQWLYVLLEKECNEIVVTQSDKHQNAKTDFKEAREHAENLRTNHIERKVYHSSDSIMELRSLVSGYQDLVKNIVADKNRYKALFRQSAIIKSGASFYTDRELIETLSTGSQRFVAGPLYDRIQLLMKHKARYEKQFDRNVQKFKAIKLLTSVPGLGVIRANQIVALVVSPHRFATKYNFFAYCMLVDHIQMSDGKVYGRKKPQGQSQLKGIFKSSRTSVLRGSSALRTKYELMQQKGTSQQAAYAALSRTIAAVTLGVWKSGRKFNDKQYERKIRNAYALAKT